MSKQRADLDPSAHKKRPARPCRPVTAVFAVAATLSFAVGLALAQENTSGLSRLDLGRMQATDVQVREAVEVLERYLTVKRTEQALRAAELSLLAAETERPSPLTAPTISTAAPALGDASLSISDQLHLADSSAVFKNDQLFLWDDSTRNLGLGRQALEDNQSGIENTVFGTRALSHNTTGLRNTAVGEGALYYNQYGDHNTAVGWRALDGTSGSYDNTAIGSQALVYTSGDGNTGLGRRAGHNNSAGNDSIFIANEGEHGDNATIKIGTHGTQTTAFIAGIHETSLSGIKEHPVCVDDQGQLGRCSEPPQ